MTLAEAVALRGEPQIDVARMVPRWAENALSAADDIAHFGVDVGETLAWCVRTGREIPRGRAVPIDSWNLLARTAWRDVGAARVLEPHLDALTILAEAAAAGHTPDLSAIEASGDSSWGVFAAEGGRGRLRASVHRGSALLSGPKPWCSLATDLSHALVTAWVDDEHRQLFAVSLDDPGVTAHTGPWFARGLSQVVSVTVDFDAVPGIPVGPPEWYLERPGFPVGGIGVAAAWWGGACQIVASLAEAAASENADQISLMHLGDADADLWAARATLFEAAHLIASAPGDVDLRLLANRTRTIVATSVERVMASADSSLGPLPLVADEDHARRVADLHLYLRQHHGARDSARIGRAVARSLPW